MRKIDDIYVERIKSPRRGKAKNVTCTLWKCIYREKGEFTRRVALFCAEDEFAAKVMCRGWAAQHGFRFVKVTPLISDKDVPKELIAQMQGDANEQKD